MTTRRTTIHYGLRNQGKIEALLESRLVSPSAEAPDWLVLVPSRFRAANLVDRLSPAAGAFFLPPVLTFREQLARLFRHLAPGLRLLSDFEKRSFLANVLRSLQAEFSPGRVAQVARLISAVKSQNITDADLLRLKLRRERTILTEAEEESLRIFAAYQRELSSQGLEDWEGAYCRVHDGLVTGEVDLERVHPGLRRLLVELPVRISPIESSILALLASPVLEVHLLAPLQNPASSAEIPGWSFLLKLAAEVQIHESPAPSPRVVRHPSDGAEIAWLVARVERILEREGEAARLGIVPGSSPGFRKELLQVLEERGIEAFCPGLFEAESGSMEGAFLHYLHLLSSDFGRVELFDFLAESRVECGLDASTRKRLEEISKRAGIEAHPRQWNELFPKAAQALLLELRLPEGTVPAFLNLFEALQLELGSSRSFATWYLDCSDRLEPLLVRNRLGGGEGKRLSQFREAVRLQSEIWGEVPLSFPDFVSLFRDCLGWRRETPPQLSAGVWIGRPDEFQNCHLTHLFWCGLSSDSFPREVDDPLAEEEVPGPFRTASREQRFQEAELTFRNLVSESSRVTCSFHDRAAERGAEASPFLLGLEWEWVEGREGIAAVSADARGNIERGREIQAIRESDPFSTYSGFLRTAQAQEAFRQRLWREDIRLTPTTLEQYAGCGFRFFANRILGLQRRPVVGSAPAPSELGQLIHRILYRFRRSGFVDPAGVPPDREKDWVDRQSARMRRIASQEIERLRSRFEWGSGLFWEHAEQRLLGGPGGGTQSSGLLAAFLNWEWNWSRQTRSARAELHLGPLVAGEIQSPAGPLPVLLEGRLDRVDRVVDGLVVIDYKTGSDARGRCYQGWGFQLPLYAALAAEELGQPVSDAFFLAVRFPQQVQPERLRMPVSDRAGHWLALMAFYRSRLLELVSQLYQGAFPPTLVGRSRAGCRSCDYREICRFDGRQASRLTRSGQVFVPRPLLESGQWMGLAGLED